jgi:DNA (cytosine-5)-methyltransferase 1
MKNLKVLELFGGIGACSKALERLNIEHEVVDYVEIDKYAVKSYNAIHGTNFEPQDITQWDKDIEVDLIMHGSPCQDFSLAGKQAGGDKDSGTRSSLLYETVRIVEKIKPKYVIWENVKNVLSQKHRHNFDNYLSEMEELGYTNYYQVLNAKDYGIPQNRERVFTISILNGNNYEFPKIQELKTIPLDYIEENADEKYNLTDKNIKHYQREFGSKGKELDLYKPIPTLTSAMGTGGGNVPYFTFPPKQELQLRLKDMLENEVDDKYYLSEEMVDKIKASNFIQERKRIQEKEYCDTLLARDWKDPKCVQVGTLDIKGMDCVKRVYSDEGLSPTLTDMQGGNRQPKIIDTNFSRHREYSEYSCAIDTYANKLKVENDCRIRKLTPKECFRLMGFDDADFEKASQVNSNSQLYKQAGNSIVVNVLEAIFTNLLK